MPNYFVACGGTGAHVMLAMVRLHLLGYPFGFFTPKDGKNFPDLFLIDQDSGSLVTGKDKNTAMGEIRHLLRIHPGRYDPQVAFGVGRNLKISCVSPLPVGDGDKEKWYDPPNDKLKHRFSASDILDLITTDRQQDIEYSGGMMASPAVGSLLFRLKDDDRPNPGAPNNDKDYNTLLTDSANNPVVVCGSIVGGTGASVTPTLARQLKDGQASEVMAVLVHRWFNLVADQGGKKFDAAVGRNKEMAGNAASGLVSSAEELANHLPTVLVGATGKGMKDRKYGGNYLMPIEDSYIHAVAALAGMTHLLGAHQPNGLYGVSASVDHELSNDIKIGNSTLGNLIDHAELFSKFLEVYCKAPLNFNDSSNDNIIEKFLKKISTGFSDSPRHEIHKQVYKAVGESSNKVGTVFNQLKEFKDAYDESLDWLRSLTSRKSIFTPKDNIGSITFLNERLKVKPLDGSAGTRTPPIPMGREEYIALSLYHWLAEWTKDYYAKKFKNLFPSQGSVKKGYWPSINNPTLLPAFSNAGTLAGLRGAGNIGAALKAMYDPSKISQNGWPHCFAASKQFKFLVKTGDKVAIRKLEMLLVGHALGYLKLEPVKFLDKNKRITPSIDTLLEEKGNGLAKYRLRDKKNDIVYGFSSPDTLLCPTPRTNDKAWQKLWDKITDHTDPNADYKTSQKWGYFGNKARSSVAFWIQQLTKYYPNEPTLDWVKPLKNNPQDGQPYGIVEWLLLSDNGNNEIKLPLPHVKNTLRPSQDIIGGIQSFDAHTQDKKIQTLIPSFNKWNNFSRIKEIFLPGLKNPISLIWKEHLDGLQKKGEIFAWGSDKKDHIWVMTDLESDLIEITNLRVIDIEKIRIPTCIPLKQNPVPGSNTKKGSIIFPDLPLLPEYTSLAMVPPGNTGAGKAMINHNWNGLSDYKWDNNTTVEWDVYLMGRPQSKPEKIEVTIDKNINPEAAHWMIWPNFKSPKKDPTPWRAYYVYEDSSRPSLQAHVLTQKNDGSISRPKKRPLGISGPSRSVESKNGQHTGGAPVALCAYDDNLGEYVGLYKIKLNGFDNHANPTPWKLALDFGTSHTVMAREGLNDGNAEIISLSSELTPESPEMSLHISQNWPEQRDVERKKSLEVWRPTYVEKKNLNPSASQMLRSDLWSSKKKEFGTSNNMPKDWEPMTHYALPSWNLHRESLGDVISGFKWEMNDAQFAGYERWLQKRYLAMVIELFLAEVIMEKGAFPHKVQFTFTYPLRGNKDNYKNMIQNKVLPKCAENLGFDLDGIPGNNLSLLSESHAAAGIVGTGNPCEVKLVADLGGGTLDIFISTSDTSDREDSDSRFKTIADSAKIGANHLLKILAKYGSKYLPNDSAWRDSYEEAYINLCVWMRLKGSRQLFDPSGINSEIPPLKLNGFQDGPSGSKARILISKYFYLITDFLARNLVAYVTKHVLKELTDQELKHDLKLFLQLQGNGWRLWYQSDDYNQIHQQILKLIKERANLLWNERSLDSHDFSIQEDLWDDENRNLGPDPKTGPICNAVGKGSLTDGTTNYHKFPLSKVKIFHPEEETIERNWFDLLPFEKLPQKSTPRIKEFDPGLWLGRTSKEISAIEAQRMAKINAEIESPTWGINTMDAPIGAAIWEQMLKSAYLRMD